MKIFEKTYQLAEYAARAYEPGAERAGDGIEFKIFSEKNTYYICIRGTEIKSYKDAKACFKAWPKFTRNGLIHKGAYNRAKKLWSEIEDRAFTWHRCGYEIVLVGHSMGGMLATVIAEMFCPFKISAYSFGSAPAMRLFRPAKAAGVAFANGDDPIPQFNTFGLYQHYGKFVQLGGKPDKNIFDNGILDHPIKKYMACIKRELMLEKLTRWPKQWTDL